MARDAANKEPEELLYRVEEGKVLLELGHVSKALACFQMASPILRKESERVELATAYLHAGDADHCWEILEPLLAASPRVQTLALAGETLMGKVHYAEAIFYFTLCIEKGGDTHQIQTLLGHSHRLSGNFGEAERIYRKILEKDSSDVAATLGLGACMEERGFYQRALSIYRAGKAWEKKDPRLLLQAAGCSFYIGRFYDAEEYYSQIIENKGHTPDLLAHYGYVLEMQQKWEAAENTYLKAIELFPADPKGYRALSWLFGVGLTVTLSNEEGLALAHQALSMSADLLSYEVLSAAEARAGNFEAAHQIQEYLSTLDKEPSERIRRSHLLKALRKHLPLDSGHVSRRLVA